MPIAQTVTVPPNRRLMIDVPMEVPIGKVVVKFFPVPVEQQACSESAQPETKNGVEMVPDAHPELTGKQFHPRKPWEDDELLELRAFRAERGLPPPWDPAQLERAQKLAHKRIGWAPQDWKCPDNFDTMCRDEIIAMFEGKYDTSEKSE